MITIPDLTQAITILSRGGLVAFPTETVYGLGADANNEDAIRKIFLAKERPYDHPLIVHIGDITQLSAWASDIPPIAQKLAETFWPGPLTLILKKQPHVLDIVTGGQQTVGVRMPHHPIALALLKAYGKGIVAPSANKFTHISPTTAQAVEEELGKKVDLILDGGPCEVGLESTIVDVSDKTPAILRPGMISAEKIANVLRMPITTRFSSQIKTPGMHHLHYAPRTRTELITQENLSSFLQTLTQQDLPIACVIRKIKPIQIQGVTWIPMPHDVHAYAHDLYQILRHVDHQQFKRIMIEDVPEDSAWEAVRDRIKKASHD